MDELKMCLKVALAFIYLLKGEISHIYEPKKKKKSKKKKAKINKKKALNIVRDLLTLIIRILPFF